MKKLINLSNGKTIRISSADSIPRLGGPDQWAIEEGRYVWLAVPAGENPDDCVLSGNVLIVDPNLKNARLASIAAENAKKTQLAQLKARLIELDNASDLTVAEVKENIRKLLKLIKLKGLLD